MAVEGTFPITINATPEAVWPWIADLAKHGEWSPKPYRVELVSGETGKVGSRYRSAGWIPGDKDHANDVEITESVPHSRFALRADEQMGSFANTYDLTPVAGGTEVTYRLVFPKVGGVQGLMLPILFPLVGKPNIGKRMKLLKAKVEGTA